MAQFTTVTVRWAPPPKRGKPRSADNVPAEVAVRVLVDGLNEYADTVKAEAKAILNETAAAVQTDAMTNVPEVFGHLRRSLRIEAPGEFHRRVTAGDAAAPYALYIEYGTFSGAPPLEKIINWMTRKGIAPMDGRTKEQSAGLIRKKIMARGIRPQPFLFPAFERHRQPFIDKMSAIFQ